MPGKFQRNAIGGHVWVSDDGPTLPVHIDTGGAPRVLAALRPHPHFGGFPRAMDRITLIPRNHWTQVDLSRFQTPILDQGQTASCVGHGACTGFTRAWQMSGHPLVRFSPTYVYGKINGGQDQGAVVSDALTQLIDGGICREETVPEGDIYSANYPPAADAEAANYRMQDDVLHAGTFDEIVSGLLLGWLPVFGIVVGNSFSRVDAGGVPGVGGGGEGGHCLTGCGVAQVPSGSYRGQWAVLTQNSWGQSWGMGGFCNLTLQHFTYMAQWMGGLDCFLIRGVLDAPDDAVNPPSAIS